MFRKKQKINSAHQETQSPDSVLPHENLVSAP